MATREPGDLPSAVVTRASIGQGVPVGGLDRQIGRQGAVCAVTCHTLPRGLAHVFPNRFFTGIAAGRQVYPQTASDSLALIQAISRRVLLSICYVIT